MCGIESNKQQLQILNGKIEAPQLEMVTTDYIKINIKAIQMR